MKKGPILTPMEDVLGSDSTNASGDCTYNGVDGYPKGSGGKIEEVTFEETGDFGKERPGARRE